MEKRSLLNKLYGLYKDFRSSPLYISGAQSIVYGDGSAESTIVFIGEAPGREEDKQAKPFVGRSGQLLTRAIEAAGCKRSDVFITNIVKCRPPENRTPVLKEIQTGKALILNHELDIIKPKVVVTLGLSSLQGLLEHTCTMAQYRGKQENYKGAMLYPSYHPAYVLRNPSAKDVFFSDIKKVLELAGMC